MRKIQRITPFLVCGAALLFAASRALSQQITCMMPNGCTLRTTSETAQQYIIVRVTGVSGNNLSNARVSFRQEKGSGRLSADDVFTDDNGLATTVWTPSAASPFPAEIRVSVPSNAGIANQLVSMSVVPGTAFTLAQAPSDAGDYQWWYEDRQLRHTVRVEVRGPDASSCQRAAVSFRPIGGGGSAPDTVYGEWDAQQQRCLADAWWRLPKGVGTHALRASLAGEPAKGTTFFANARALPRIVIGVAGYGTHSFSRVQTVADTLQVTREFPDGTTITRDSVEQHPTVKTEERKVSIAPTIGVDFPLSAGTQRVRMSLMTTLKDPDRNAFLGFSIPQLFRGLGQEAIGIDLHLSLHVQRQETLRTPGPCESNPNECGTMNKLRLGVGIMGITDTNSIVSTLSTMFGIK